MGLPIFVLLFDVCGSGPGDFDMALDMQHRLMREGADDVLCYTRTSQELQLAVAMAMHRHTVKLSTLSRVRSRLAREVGQSIAERAVELEEVHATGLFWQSVDRLFKDFPAMDLKLPKELGPGTCLGPCTLDARLGAGSFGKVYSATNDQSGWREAVKVIAKSSVKHCKQATALHREIELHSRLEHRDIVRFLGAMHGPLHVFIRMEALGTCRG